MDHFCFGSSSIEAFLNYTPVLYGGHQTSFLRGVNDELTQLPLPQLSILNSTPTKKTF